MAQYLNEERYQNVKNKISKLSIIVLCVGLLIGVSLIITGIVKSGKSDSSVSKQEVINQLNVQITAEKQLLEEKKAQLQSSGVTFNGLTNYEDGESYDLKVITNVLNPSTRYCAFDEYINNSITKQYCQLSNQLRNVENSFTIHSPVPSGNAIYFILGAFVIMATLVIFINLFFITKKREIAAFGVQQALPIVQETIQSITPTVADAIEKMTPTVSKAQGNIAKEIAKGVKEGLKDEE